MLKGPRAATGALVKAVSIAGLALAMAALLCAPAQARMHRHYNLRGKPARHHAAAVDYGPTDPSKDAALIIDGASGRVLLARNATALRHPASLTKMMTLYLLFGALQRGQVTMQTLLPISEHAADQAPTKMGLYPGDTISVDDAIRSIVIKSANDIAVAIAESLGGTESNFCQTMTQKARELGMRNTFYHNASGLPDDAQITTAADLAVLARHLAYDYPQYFHYFSLESFNFRGRYLTTHDNLIGRYEGADGIKTGYTVASGFNLVSSVVRGKTHLLGVVMGGYTSHRRDNEMIRLLDVAFAQIGQNPSLVASATVPWRTVAANSAGAPAIAGFDLSGLANARLAAPQAPEAQQPVLAAQTSVPFPAVIAPAPAPRQQIVMLTPKPRPAYKPRPGEDEETAEIRSAAEDDAIGNVIARSALPKPNIQLKPPAQQPAQKPGQKPQTKPVLLAALQPQNVIVPRPSPRWQAVIGQGDFGAPDKPIGGSMSSLSRNWSIQIGAFTDQKAAQAQLATYAEKSMDVLGTAKRLVAPFQAVDGHTMYRARFGPFVEREAREVCARLTERGQTCFAAVAGN
jgi:D-alanyl-D-alanine carboxypeptidase